MNNNQAELKGCPFRHSVKQGSLADDYEPYSTDGLSEDPNWCVYCPVCKSASGFYDTEQEAQEAWNRRIPPATSKSVDELAREVWDEAIAIAINEQVDAEATEDATDAAYNMAIAHVVSRFVEAKRHSRTGDRQVAQRVAEQEK